MQLPFFETLPSYDVLPAHRFDQFYNEPEPPLTYLLGCFTPEGLHLQLRTYEGPNFHSYFCFTLISGKKLCFSKNIFPGRPDPTLHSTPISGENLVGKYWGTEIFIPNTLCPSPISGVIGLMHDDIPLCFLCEHKEATPNYPKVLISPKRHPKPSSREIQEEIL